VRNGTHLLYSRPRKGGGKEKERGEETERIVQLLCVTAAEWGDVEASVKDVGGDLKKWERKIVDVIVHLILGFSAGEAESLRIRRKEERMDLIFKDAEKRLHRGKKEKESLSLIFTSLPRLSHE